MYKESYTNNPQYISNISPAVVWQWETSNAMYSNPRSSLMMLQKQQSRVSSYLRYHWLERCRFFMIVNIFLESSGSFSRSKMVSSIRFCDSYNNSLCILFNNLLRFILRFFLFLHKILIPCHVLLLSAFLINVLSLDYDNFFASI